MTFDLTHRFAGFVAERHPLSLQRVLLAWQDVCDVGQPPADPGGIEALRPPLHEAIARSLSHLVMSSLPETTPGISGASRVDAAIAEVQRDCDGFLAREAIAASLSTDEKREMLRGMLLTRAVDNRLKAFFTNSDVRYGASSFQGKGFRSLGQEAIYAAPLRLKRGAAYRSGDAWQGDVVAPMIRDLGAVLAMRPERETVRMVLSAQMAKDGPPMKGRDFHVGDFTWGIFPASAPLGVSAATVAGLAMAFHLDASPRVAVSLIGEGASSMGEWHEAINLCAAKKLPAIFCIENNQTALSTPVREQSAVRVFADKGLGYGISAVTIDGTDPEAIAATFSWAAQRARAGEGPALIELVCMRMCGHAHHDDMLYIGKEPAPGWDYPALTETGYANRDSYEFWRRRDPIVTYTRKLEADGIVTFPEVEAWKEELTALVEDEARAVIEAPWPKPEDAGKGVFANEAPRVRLEVLDPAIRASSEAPRTLTVEESLSFDPKGRTFLDAVMLGVGDALAANPDVFVYGEDVGGRYGNAFLLLRPLLKDFGDRIINSTLAEGGVLGVCIGSALAGKRPIGEMQFNDFVATGFNQLVNNAAKIRYRWGGSVPMVIRMPWGGLRHAGPYHSQNTEAWFYRTPGLKIVCPSTPEDARRLMAAAVADPDPVLFYEHIALYRDPRVKQALPVEAPGPMPLGQAALRRSGSDLAIISYGAYVHAAMRVAEKLASDGIECSVLDLRSITPLDREAILSLARHCSRVLIVHEDTRTGGIGESIAAIIQEEAFEFLDAPIRILGALDTPVPYSPPLEDFFLPSEDEMERAARLLAAW